jgi:hypothetical protein
MQSVLVAGQIAGILVTPLLVPAWFSIETYFQFSTLALVLVGVYSMLSLRLQPKNILSKSIPVQENR